MRVPTGSEAPGLVAAGGELTSARLGEAYSKGIFPWYSEGQPVLWWSPDPRMVLLPAEFSLARSLRKTIRRFLATPAEQPRLRIGSEAPNFQAKTTAGDIEFHQWLDGKWAILFSHPADFTPVCTTELGAFAKLGGEFEKRGVKMIGLVSFVSCSHIYMVVIYSS